ncbi:MAG: hypothetical protein WC335_00325 [Candidatus Omnitrophota bacterium]
MKVKEQKEAKRLRSLGYSLREIVEKTGCAKSSVSDWVREISLTAEQIERLEFKQDQARAKAANHPNSPKNIWAALRKKIADAAFLEISSRCSKETLKILGGALYWAEGYKATVNVINFSNSDPAMIALMMRFFREVCNVPEQKFRGLVNIHPHLDREKAEKFWSKISEIPLSQFHKTQFGISKASKHKRDTLPLGTFRIVVCDTRLKAKIDGWIAGIGKWSKIRALSSAG